MQLLRGKTDDWANNDKVLKAGQPAVEYGPDGSTKLKIGNGVDLFRNLPYVSSDHNNVSVEDFRAAGLREIDIINNAINYVMLNGGTLHFKSAKRYDIEAPIKIIAESITAAKSFKINFNNCIITSTNFTAEVIQGVEINAAIYVYVSGLNIRGSYNNMMTIENLSISGNNETIHTGMYLASSTKIKYSNITIADTRTGITQLRGVESFFENIHISRNSTLDILDEIDVTTTDCIGVYCNSTDNHFSNIIVIDYVIGMKMLGGDNRVYGAHVWNYYCQTQYKYSVCFMNGGANFYTDCVADHFYAAWYVYYATQFYLQGCNITCQPVKLASDKTLNLPLSSYCFYFGANYCTNKTGSDIIVTNTRISGNKQMDKYDEAVNLKFSNVAECNINYSGKSEHCQGVPDSNMQLAAGGSVVNDKNGASINHYGEIKSVEKVIQFSPSSTDFSDIGNATYSSGSWIYDYLQVSKDVSVSVDNGVLTILANASATGYNYLKLYLHRLPDVHSGDFLLVAYKYKSIGKSKVIHYNQYRLNPYTSADSGELICDGEWHNGYCFVTWNKAYPSDAIIEFGDWTAPDTENPLYLCDMRILNLSNYNIPRYYLETDKAYRERLIRLVGTEYLTDITIPAVPDISFLSLPCKFDFVDISSAGDMPLGFTALGNPMFKKQDDSYIFELRYHNSTSYSRNLELEKYSMCVDGTKDNVKVSASIGKTVIPLYNYTYTKNMIVPPNDTLCIRFEIPSLQADCILSKLQISPYSLTDHTVVDGIADTYTSVPLYAGGEVYLVAKARHGAELPTAYVEMKYCNSHAVASAMHPYSTVADMQADIGLEVGSAATTAGYYVSNDLGSAEYIVGTTGNIPLKNGLFAQIITKSQMNIECFGAKGDGSTDDSIAISEASKYDTQLLFSNKVYFISSAIETPSGVCWKGNKSIFKIADTVNIDNNASSILTINGDLQIEDISIEYKSQYISDVSDLTLMKIVSGEHHHMKDTNIYISERSWTHTNVRGIWFDFADRSSGSEVLDQTVHNLHVDNCNIHNLTTGTLVDVDTLAGTGCLWASGAFDSILIKNSSFTRNHSSSVIALWASGESIDNILIEGCTFNLTDDTVSTSACIQLGVSTEQITTFNQINIYNTTFNIGKGFGAPCIGIATPSSTINVHNCNFLKDVPTVTSYTEYQKRLEVAMLENNSILNMYDSTLHCTHDRIYLCDMQDASTTCTMNIHSSQIYAHSNVCSPINANFYSTRIDTETASSALESYTDYLVALQFNGCTLNCNITNRCSLYIWNSVCYKHINNEIKSDIAQLQVRNSSLADYIVTLSNYTGSTLTDYLLNTLEIINNTMTRCKFASQQITIEENGEISNTSTTDVALSELATISRTAIVTGNIDTSNRTVIDTVLV